MTRTPRGRSAVACKACHTQKLKCNGGAPCERCQTRGRPCVYPVREKYITVPQSYLRRLERQPAVAQRSGDPISSPESVRTDPNEFATPLSPKSSQIIKEEELEDCSAEFFVKRLRQLSWTAASGDPTSKQTRESTGTNAESYTYSRLKFDFLQSEVSFRLPPRPYAFHLLQAFDEGFSEYHWFLRKRFRERILLTYSDPQSQSHDRNWLCRVSVVLALAESWNRSRMSSAVHMEIAGKHPTSPPQKGAAVPLTLPPHSHSTSQTLPPPPGSEFFEQGLMLLKMSAEEPVPEDVEALCLIELTVVCPAKFGYWESLHLFSGLAILALARVSIEEGKDFNPNSEDDVALYTRTRALLREMARVGNPAAKDHDVLLSDVEAMVKRISREEKTTPRQFSVEEADGNVEMETDLTFSDFMFSDGNADQQIWSDKDWESILSTYTQGI
ncbi:C6 transcription factor [Colletotrichum scovillei]|uniref:C6 transcription factor n=1 Tax=Colletotrichum scovillei TaxID=1209932 RepID=UPI0015C3EDFF|nr:C6 transcription factor [Colletotrichum scovillei]KAF4774651.1 C6 transcription factor [Colletotrichum scovillei]